MITMKSHNLKGFLAIAVGALMVISALVVLFDTPQPGTGSLASNSQITMTTDNNAMGAVDTSQPLDSASVINMMNAAGIPSKFVYLPNLNSMASYTSLVTSLYSRSPAPMGVADYGYMNSSGVDIPYSYNTTSFMGTAMFEAFKPYYAMNGAPDSVSIQLNTVLNGVTVFGDSNNVYWTQNVAYYTPSSGEVELVDNVWNFSSPSMYMPSSSIYSGSGHVVSDTFYYSTGPQLNLEGTYTLNLFTNSTVINNRNAVVFSYSITNTANNQTISQNTYDTVIFNSTVPGSSSTTGQAYFEVNGYAKTPSGMLYDAEMVIGGPGAGSTSIIYEATAQLNLKFMSGGTYAKLPSAYNYGSNGAETVEGLSAWWTSTMKPIVHLSSGPSLLVSMWGSTFTHSGAMNIQGTISPANSFLFLNTGTTFDNSTAAWAPLNESGYYKFALPGGIDYSGVVMMSEFQPFYFNTSAFETNETVNETGPGGGGSTNETNETTTSFNVSLAYDRNMGIYTPLYAMGDAQLANLTVGSTPYTTTATPKGSGTPSDPYRIENNQYAPLNHLFTLANKFMYPSFYGLFISDTTANATIQDPAQFSIQYPSSMSDVLDAMNLPVTNNLNMVFYNTSGVSLFGANDITGWFASSLQNMGASNVLFIDSTSFLVGESTFNGMGSSLLIYNEPGNNGSGTVFGNHFMWHLITKSAWADSLMYGSDPYGISVYSSGNLIYNNYFDTVNPAYSPAVDLYTGNSATYSNNWNLSQIEPLTYSITVNGFDLTGNIIGLGHQGGNYWSEFDGTLPYSSSGGITTNGDYYPLVPPTYGVTFNSVALPAGNNWGIVLDNNSVTTTGSSVSFQMPNGTYSYSVITPDNYAATPLRGEVTVYGNAISQSISFSQVIYPITVTMTGLPSGTQWGINLAGEPYKTTGDSITIYRDNGTYGYSIIVPDLYSVTPSSGNLFIYGHSASLNVVFSLTTYTVTFEHIGLPTGTEWAVTFDNQTVNTTSASISFTLTNGNYTYNVSSVNGYSMTPESGYVVVENDSATVTIQFTQNPNTLMTVGLLVGGIAVGAGAGVALAYFFMRKP